uniref:TOG domain-containing protein n=1 Tax=Caenorhabditis tropicalis TaxID=1561998 RepID=A0A1I7UYS4_9PELO
MVAATEMDGDSRIEHDQGPIDDDDDDLKDRDPPVMKLDFEKLFKMAEDPDLEELLRSPLDQALINLEDGTEVQKLTAIRTFPDILDTSDGEKCLLKMLPAIQRCLKVEKSNLDLHCEAAVVYKSIIQNDSLVKKFQGIVDLLLENILQNVQNQKEHHVHEKEKVIIKAGSSINNQMHHLSAAAWLETIVEVAEKLSLSSIKQFIIPVIQTQAEPVQRVQRRIIATKIIHKLALFLPPNEIRKDLCPIVITLCKDANSNVRVAVAQRLFVIANALKNSHDVVSSLLPSYVHLLNDEEMNVREAAMNSLTDSFSLFTRGLVIQSIKNSIISNSDARKHTLFSVIKKLTEEALEKKNEGLPVISNNFGKWSWELNELLDQLDKSWILNTYCKMVQISDELCEGPQKNIRNVLKKTCCFNYPCMLTMFEKQVDRLLPFLEMFCTDHDEEVRISIAASYHEILMMFPDKTDLIPPFIELLHGGSSDVIAKISHNLSKILPILYENVKNDPGRTTVQQLDRLLIGCNQILRNSSSWRSHESFLKSLKVLSNCIEEEVIIDTFLPLLKKEVLNVRAIPCRVAACETILILMRNISKEEIRTDIIKFFTGELSNHNCCYRRITYIDVAELVLSIFSKRIFIENFLDDTLRLTSDAVSNIRIRAIKFLSKIKAKLQLPEDEEILLKVENSVKEQLKSTEQTGLTRAIINQAAVELSRCETCSDSQDEMKIKEENELWSEKKTENKKESKIKKPSIRSKRTKETKMENEEKEEEEEEIGEFIRSSSLRIPTQSVRATSPWRTERKAIAVVRPQPVITVRSQSPSPMSYRSPSPAPKESTRPSRLPLSSAAKERDKLRKMATDAPPPPARSARSASVVASRRSDAMTSSTSSLESSNSTSSLSSALPSSGYGLRRSATSSSSFAGSSYTSTSSYSLMNARSSSNIRRPVYGLSHVSSLSTFERKPSQLSCRVRNLD